MQPSRLLLIPCAALILICLAAISKGFSFRSETNDFESAWSASHSLRPFFFFQSPVSLFVPSATISLTNDNSTFFVARPAAFGPSLPSQGLSGELWVGSSFSTEFVKTQRLDIGFEGELGCGDIQDWPKEDTNYPVKFRSNAEQTPYPGFSLDEEIEQSELCKKETGNDPRACGEDPERPGKLTDKTRPESASAFGFYGRESRQTEEQDLQPPSHTKYLQQPDQIFGKVVLLSRGGCEFSEKVKWAQRRGAKAVIIGDNQSGPLVQMYARDDTSNITIPSIFTFYTSAEILSSLIPDWSIMSSSAKKISQRQSDTELGLPGIKHNGAGADINTNQQTRYPLKFLSSIWSRPAQKYHSLTTFGRLKALLRREVSNVDSRRPQAFAGFSQEHHRATLDVEGALMNHHEEETGELSGLWVTLTPADMNSSPFFHTIFVLVVSPLLTLIIVYSMLLLRSRIRRRRWRAPKSLVERLPVRIYHTFSSASSSTALGVSAQESPTLTTPLLARSRIDSSSAQSNSYDDCELRTPKPSNISDDALNVSDSEKPQSKTPDVGRPCKVKHKECVVCLEEYVNGVSRVMCLPCGHEFHAECITPWLTTRRRTCPICKGDVVRSMRRREVTDATASAEMIRPDQ